MEPRNESCGDTYEESARSYRDDLTESISRFPQKAYGSFDGSRRETSPPMLRIDTLLSVHVAHRLVTIPPELHDSFKGHADGNNS
jgi:hypothetical protein